jgi:hypothetical protein
MDEKGVNESLLAWLLREFPSTYLFNPDHYDSITECVDSVILRLGEATVTIYY